MDVLADIVSSLALRSSLYFRAELGLPFAIAVPEERRRIRFHVVAEGRAWIGLPGGDGDWLAAGDLVLVPHGAAHVLASEPERSAVPLAEVLAETPVAQGVLRSGTAPGAEPAVRLVCGHFQFDETLVHPLIESLPPWIHLPATGGAGYAWLGPLLELVEREATMDAPGSRAVARRLAEVLFIQVLRQAIANDEASGARLAVLEDPQLGRALRSIHEEPEASWSLDKLARVAGVSRTLFVDRFRERLGMPPMRYLACWRMQRARALLADDRLSVGEVALRVGYGSEAAFSRAFRDLVGEPPGRHRRQRLAESA